jgi:SM-20-related protein
MRTPSVNAEGDRGSIPVRERALDASHPHARPSDVFHGRGSARRLTAIYYLNEDWRPEDGGQLRLFLPSVDRDIAPIADRLLVFMSAEVEHAVLPALAERWALTAWHSGACRLPGA